MKKLKIFTTFALIAMLSVNLFSQGYYFVKEGGSGTQDGTSWANASPSIQAMLDIAVKDESIWVASGTYYPESLLTGYIPTTDRLKTFFFPHDTVALLGGFAGNENPETFDLSQRDFMANETILSGDIGVPGDSTDNCYHIFYMSYDTSIVIDGFTVERGIADHPNYDLFQYGGAIFARKSVFTMNNMIFRNNYTIRTGNVFLGRYGEDCQTSITNSLFEHNYSSQTGGGIGMNMTTFNAMLSVDNCRFINNTGLNGGSGLFFIGADISITNSTFEGNHSVSGDDYGAAVYIHGCTNILQIKDCDFSNNSAYAYGGAVSINYSNGSGLIEDCSFSGNHSNYYGGAISLYYSSVTMNRLTFGSNTSGNGGAIYEYNGNATLNNSLIYGNSANIGGAVNCDGNLIMANTTITGNSAVEKGDLYFHLHEQKIFNVIVWNNTGQNQVYIDNDITEPEFYYCDIEGGKEGFGGTGSGSSYSFDYDNANNIDSDPFFANAAADDFTLSDSSPCINSGTPLGVTGSPYPYIEQSCTSWILHYNGGTDNLGAKCIGNNTRVCENRIDIGGYERHIESNGITLDLKAFLEGPFEATEMVANLSDIPLSQPYNKWPWYYAGNESVAAIPNANVVDWVLIELRDATGAEYARPCTSVESQAAFILEDGSIVGTDGSSLLQFNHSVDNGVFIVIWHRNHLGIMSASPATLSGGIYLYDFTTNVNKAYLSGEKTLNGKAVMIGGDINRNGKVNASDKTAWSGAAGNRGYLFQDTDLDNQVDNKDKNDVWAGNVNEQTKVPE